MSEGQLFQIINFSERFQKTCFFISPASCVSFLIQFIFWMFQFFFWTNFVVSFSCRWKLLSFSGKLTFMRSNFSELLLYMFDSKAFPGESPFFTTHFKQYSFHIFPLVFKPFIILKVDIVLKYLKRVKNKTFKHLNYAEIPYAAVTQAHIVSFIKKYFISVYHSNAVMEKLFLKCCHDIIPNLR